ncbi:hypothetical protein EON62_04345, partial [archaeon]
MMGITWGRRAGRCKHASRPPGGEELLLSSPGTRAYNGSTMYARVRPTLPSSRAAVLCAHVRAMSATDRHITHLLLVSAFLQDAGEQEASLRFSHAAVTAATELAGMYPP